MSVSNLTNIVTYVGNGTNQNFPVTFELRDATHLLVYLRDLTVPATPVVTLLVYGALQDYVFTGADPANGIICTGILTTLAPTVTKRIILKRVMPLAQGLVFPINGPFPAKDNELAHDNDVMMSQQLQEQLNRTPKFAITSPTTGITFPEPSATMPIIGWNAAGTDLENKSLLTLGLPVDLTGLVDKDVPTYSAALGKFVMALGGGGLLVAPTDGVFGGAAGPIAGCAVGDTVSDAFDKVETVLGKLAPAPPAALSTKTLVITGSYGATPQASAIAVAVVIDVTTPTIGTTNFADGDNGTLSAEVDAAPVGSRILSPANDSGTYTNLVIVSDVDPYFGIAGKAGFWTQLSANIVPSALALGAHTAQLKHTTKGNSGLLAFDVDDPGVVTLSSMLLSSTGTSTLVSGVPGLATGQPVASSWSVGNAVRSHYNSTTVARVDSSFTPAYNQAPTGSPVSGATLSFSQAMVVNAGVYTETFSANFSGYNSKGGATTSNLSTAIRIDTISNETVRRLSGQGQYPTNGAGAAQYGSAFVSSTLLTTAGNEELQMLGGVIKYPPLTNYSGSYPSGPNYTTVVGGTFANYRWVTFDTGTISAVSTLTITLNGASGLGAGTVVPGLIVQVAVVGGTPTAGWVDANANYPGTGNPTNNGDPAMVNASSSPAAKLVTFGAVPKTGNCWVRIGVPSGSTKTFTGVTRS